MDRLLPYFILAASLTANLLLFLSLKRELVRLRAKHFELFGRVEAAEKAAEEKEELNASALPVPPRPAFNLNTRVQAMRLWRQGEPPERIAALLGMPSKEVELLIRVRRMAADSSSPVQATPAQP